VNPLVVLVGPGGRTHMLSTQAMRQRPHYGGYSQKHECVATKVSHGCKLACGGAAREARDVEISCEHHHGNDHPEPDASPERSAQFGFKRVFWAFRSAHGMRA